MQKKGTGWIPDLPDVRDYNLFAGPILQVVDASGTEAMAHSLETMAQETTEALRDWLKATPSAQAQNLLAKLEQSQQRLLQSALCFQPVRVHQYLGRATNSSEVVRIKAYLKEFILGLTPETLQDWEVNNPQQYHLVKTLKSNFDWWLVQRADDDFTQLVALYQTWAENNHLLNLKSYNRPRYQGHLDPETLALFEQGQNERLYDDQIETLGRLIGAIDGIQCDLESFNKQIKANLHSHLFYDLQDIPVDSYDLQQRFKAVQKQYYQRYVEAVLPKESVAIIQAFENLRLQAYPDVNGLWIIGYGYRMKACPSRAITESEAKALLEQDLIKLILDLGLDIQRICSPNAFAAILSLVHHIGLRAFCKSTLFDQLKHHSLDAVAEEFEKWSQVNQRESLSFRHRRLAEKQLFQGQPYDLSLAPSVAAVQDIKDKPESQTTSYYDHYSETVESLLQGFKFALKEQVLMYQSSLACLKNVCPTIQRQMIACPLPEEVNQGIFQGIMTVVRASFQANDLEMAKQNQYLRTLAKDLSGETQSSAPNASLEEDKNQGFQTYLQGLEEEMDRVYQRLIQDSSLAVDHEEFQELRELLDPLIQSLVRLFSPIGVHTNIQRSIAEAMEQFQQLLAQSGLGATDGATWGAAGAIQPLDRVSQGRIAAAMREAKQRAEQQLQIAKTALEQATQHQQYHIANVDPELATGKLVKLFLVLRIIEKIDRCCTPPAAPAEPSCPALDNQPPQPTLLFVLPPEQATPAAPSAAIRDFSDALQMPISAHLRQEIQQVFQGQGRSETQGKTWLYLCLPEFVDLSYWCSAIEDQGQLNTCTAHAGVALVEYFAKRSFNRYEDLSRLFLYKVARNLMNRQGDTGASVRETMRAMVLFGVPPEERWPYVEANFETEPDPFCYAYAQNYQAIKYCRLDRVGMSPPALLAQIKAVLVAGLPCMFGFTAYQSIYAEENVCLGHIPYPTRNDVMAGGHAMVAVGYDDHHVIESTDNPDNPSVGAFLVRNSWGIEWGQGGYGWLPYDYVLGELTADWWVLLKAEWLTQTAFGGESAAWTSRLGGGQKRGSITSPNPRGQRRTTSPSTRRRH